MKIKISKSQWEEIGKQGKWLKTANTFNPGMKVKVHPSGQAGQAGQADLSNTWDGVIEDFDPSTNTYFIKDPKGQVQQVQGEDKLSFLA